MWLRSHYWRCLRSSAWFAPNRSRPRHSMNLVTLLPYNTPLARIAIGIPLYLAGERYPQLSPEDPDRQNYNYVGNKILYEDGHYLRNLELARSGVLPFLLLSVAVVFLWARREFGDFAALIAVALFTTLPVVLA